MPGIVEDLLWAEDNPARCTADAARHIDKERVPTVDGDLLLFELPCQAKRGDAVAEKQVF